MVWILLLSLLVIFIPINRISSLNHLAFVRRSKGSSEVVYQLEKCLFELKSGKICEVPSPGYKFYGEVLQNLMSLYKLTGELNLSSIDELSRALNNDFKFEQKLREVKRSSVIQFLMTSLFIWLFVGGIRLILDLELPGWCYLIITLLHSFGFLAFTMSLKVCVNRVFGQSEELYKSLVSFQSLYTSNLDINRVIDESRILSLDGFKLPLEIHSLYVRVKELVYDWKTTGMSIQNELNLYEKRFNFLQEEQFESLTKLLKVIQFLTLCLFFLPSYFVLILSLFNAFLIE